MTDPTDAFRGHIVVIFGSPNPEWCDLSHCPMQAYGPFPTSDAAKQFADRLPEWQQPHVLRLDDSSAAILADGTRG